VIYFVSGVILLIVVLVDVFQSVIPRGTSSRYRLAPFLVRKVFWPPFQLLASMAESPRWKAEVLGVFAPFVLLMLLTTWISLLISAFGLIAYALAPDYVPPLDSPLTAIYVSGASVLTLGASEFTTKATEGRFLMLLSAFFGMLITASVVSLMFALIGAIQRREVLVSVTTNIAGSPPSGVALLETISLMHGTNTMCSFYDEWHHWCADVHETHKAYPILPYFRGNDPLTSWLTTMGAVLDSTALLLCLNPDLQYFPAKMTYLFGCRMVQEYANLMGVVPETQREISGEEFHAVYMRLKAAHYCSNDEATAKANFNRLRGEYLGFHRALCKYIAVPMTPFSTERPIGLSWITPAQPT
jgi:hypothetical protein